MISPLLHTRRDFIRITAAIAAGHQALAGEAPAFTGKITAAIEGYMGERNVPGAQFALGRDGRLFFSRGFGFADRDRRTPAESATLFRIASVSKPLTAVAVLVLVEEGKLTLDSKMIAVLQPEIFLPAKGKADERLDDITIRHLLQHTGGWDRSKSGDPMFQSRQIASTLGIPCPPGAADIIRVVLGRPLDDDPGAHYAYSNFGYCLLGRIIEKVTGQPYERFVQQRVLGPAGISSPRLGATLTQAPGEARYYTPEDSTGEPVFPGLPEKVPMPYGAWCLEAMDAHGGWIASAGDIVRFAMSLDDIGGTSPFKRRETWEALTAPPPGPVGHTEDGSPRASSYVCGFSSRRGEKGLTLSHGGSLPGTTTYLYKRPDGWCWAVFFNQRHDSGKRDGAIVAPINEILDAG